MNTRPCTPLAFLAVILAGSFYCPPAKAELIPLGPGGNFNLVAREQYVTIAGKTVHAMIYEDANNVLKDPVNPLNPIAPTTPYPRGIPILVMRLNVGDAVNCKFTNLLPEADVMEGASIHWHGIELDNDSDGTAVTQDTLHHGDTYTYHFTAVRPGLFWFHSHMVPGDTLFAGMYGIIIVTGPCDAQVILPSPNVTWPIAMSDIEWDDRAGATQGKVGKDRTAAVGAIPAGTFKTMNEWITQCDLNGVGQAGGNGNPNNVCRLASDPGKTVLVNGYNPDTIANPGPLTMPVRAGQTIRLQLLNEALSRSFYVELRGPTNEVVDLIRIGGQGGLLNNARREGGSTLGLAGGVGWNSRFDPGRIMLSSGMRSDVVAQIPTWLAAGTQLTLYGRKPTDTAWNLSVQSPNVAANYPLAYFNVVAGAPPGPNPVIVDGTPLLANSGSCSVTNLTNGAVTVNGFIDPPGGVGSKNPVIQLTQANAIPSIDGLNLSGTGLNQKNSLDGNDGHGAAWEIQPLATTRYARIGDLLVLTVDNTTGVGHPFHLHGFSLQPLSMEDGNGVHNFGYNEFLDTMDVYNGEKLVFAIRLEDRPKIRDAATGSPTLQPCAAGPGGGLGHWLFHCHIAAHGVIGMIGEIVVLGNANQPMGGQPPDTLTPGVDVLATSPSGSQTVADDFVWNNPGPITHVTLWGSWLSNAVDFNATFELKFWTDVPAVGLTPSRPGWQAWEQLFFPTNYAISNFYTTPQEVFYDPSQPNCLGDNVIWQYDFDMPNLAAGFYPQPGRPVNWLSVTAYPSVPGAFFFGWKTTPPAYGSGDDSSWSSTLWGPPWTDLHYPACHPNYGISMDQAFQLSVPGVRPGTPAFGPPPPSPAAVAQPPILSATLSDGQVTISWEGGGTLQYSDSPAGPWSKVTDSVGSPYEASASAPQRFYRVFVP